MKEVPVGTLLICKPFVSDVFLKRSVVLVTESDYFSTVGFILNKPTDLALKDALETNTN